MPTYIWIALGVVIVLIVIGNIYRINKNSSVATKRPITTNSRPAQSPYSDRSAKLMTIDTLLKEEDRLNHLMHDLYGRKEPGVRFEEDVQKENEIDYQLAVVYQALGEAYWKETGLSLQDRVSKTLQNFRMATALYERVGADDKAAESLEQTKAVSASVASYLNNE